VCVIESVCVRECVSVCCADKLFPRTRGRAHTNARVGKLQFPSKSSRPDHHLQPSPPSTKHAALAAHATLPVLGRAGLAEARDALGAHESALDAHQRAALGTLHLRARLVRAGAGLGLRGGRVGADAGERLRGLRRGQWRLHPRSRRGGFDQLIPARGEGRGRGGRVQGGLTFALLLFWL